MNDQSRENIHAFADIVSEYYKQLIGRGIPQEVAQELVVNFQTTQMHIVLEKVNESAEQDDLLRSFMRSFGRGDRN